MRPFVKHYSVVGRETPSTATPNPTVYKYEVFAQNTVVAKSRFWRLMREKNKVKSTGGDVLSCTQVRDRKIAARNYSIDLCYYSQKVGFTTMTKEFRDVSKTGAVSQALNDLASRHRARFHNIEIMSVKSIANADCKRPFIQQFHDQKLSFPHMKQRKSCQKKRAIFVQKNSKRVIV